MALSPEMAAKLATALAAQNKTVDENRKKSLASATSRTLDFNVEADVKLFLEFQAGTSGIVDRDAAIKRAELFRSVYATVTGFHTLDKPDTVETDKAGKTYKSRVLFVDIAGGGSTILFFNAYDADFPAGVNKGTVITTKAIAFDKDARTMHKAAGDVYKLTTYNQPSWYAVSAFGHATSVQELTIANSAKQLKTVLAEIEL